MSTAEHGHTRSRRLDSRWLDGALALVLGAGVVAVIGMRRRGGGSTPVDPPAAPAPTQDRATAIAQVRSHAAEQIEADPHLAMTDSDAYHLDLVAESLGAVQFPATRERLIDQARQAGNEEIAVELRSLPERTEFPDFFALAVALGVGSSGRIQVSGLALPPQPSADGRCAPGV